MPISDEALWAPEEEEFLASRLAPEAPPPPKDHDEQELEWFAKLLTPPRPEAPQVDLAKVAEGTSHIPGISYIDDEEFEPLEIKPTPQDMRYARWQQLPHNALRNRLTPEDPEKVAQIAGIAGEAVLGTISGPAGIAIDIKDMAKAVETKDPVLAAMAGIGAIPYIGDIAKGTFKALRAGDRSAETVRAGRQLLEEVDHAERLWREMHTDSPYFRKWAGKDTPIVNAGDPLPEGPVVIRAYHGTPRAEFTEFDPSISREELGGMHFGTPAQSADFTRTGGPPVMPLYIRMNNPFRMEDMGSWENASVFRHISGDGLNPDWYHVSDDELIAFAETKYKGSSLQEVKATIRDPEFKGFKDRAELIGELKMEHYVENVVAPSLAEVPPGLGGDYVARHLDKSWVTEDMELSEQALVQELLSVDALEGGDLTLEEAQAFAADQYSRIRSENQNRFANRALRAKAEAEFVQKTLRHHGHDGIVYENMSEGVSIDPSTRQNVYKDSYIVFDPAKIKSTSNRGTFDPSNPDIMSAAPASLAGALDDSSVA